MMETTTNHGTQRLLAHLTPVLLVVSLAVILPSLSRKLAWLVPNIPLEVELSRNSGNGVAVEATGFHKTPPIISGSVSPQPNAAGWNNSNVTVSFTCSDEASGIASCPSPVRVTTNGANQVITRTAKNHAGDTATTSVAVNLDKTAPVISETISPPPDADGWNNSAVTVTFTCSDALSGVAICPSPVAVATAGAGQIVQG